jgi:acetyltransferase-like isoleucine patch superfamily enzyme
MSALMRKMVLKIGVALERFDDQISELTLPQFASRGRKLRIARPRRIVNPERIHIGDDVTLGPGCMLNPLRRYPGRTMHLDAGVESVDFDSRIEIGDRVSATGYLTIGAAASVVIEDDVLLASHIYIGDNLHGMARVDVPYKYQPLERVEPVRIGRGTWVGEHAVILPGVSVGEFAVIGANSVVTADVPPRTVVAGAPARPIRRWSESHGGWVRAEKDV